MPDPIASAINLMLDHIHQMENQLETMYQKLNDGCIQ